MYTRQINPNHHKKETHFSLPTTRLNYSTLDPSPLLHSSCHNTLSHAVKKFQGRAYSNPAPPSAFSVGIFFFFLSALQKVKADRAIKGIEKWAHTCEHVFHGQDRIRKTREDERKKAQPCTLTLNRLINAKCWEKEFP